MSSALPPAGGSGPAIATEPLVWAHAGFWWRVLAFLLDGAVLGGAESLLGRIDGLRPFGWSADEEVTGSVSDIAWRPGETLAYAPVWQHAHLHGGLAALLSLVIAIGYFVLLESSRWQATPGKLICRMRVTDLAGRRIGVARALGRHLGKFVSWFILGIGFLMVGWTRRKQGLHDIMAGTLVMRLRPVETVFAFQPPRSPA